ncbi:hypothetical protein GALMADRAFT_143982 [Galerina marginata CBS 339.88]|uniref:Uncharacterized protein n=1 Tax=Galerina marginata (strain CBS 339.88) TaxID=685588 RepID=A0A067SK58_GALM3|nr:hypothetical protein GALMADRAFT_143982 [Galerina marginata CBS 339.88]
MANLGQVLERLRSPFGRSWDLHVVAATSYVDGLRDEAYKCEIDRRHGDTSFSFVKFRPFLLLLIYPLLIGTLAGALLTIVPPYSYGCKATGAEDRPLGVAICTIAWSRAVLETADTGSSVEPSDRAR